MNPLYVVAIIATLAGNPEAASVASFVISALGHESVSTDDAVGRMVTMHFKNGLSDLQLYEEAPAGEKKRHARNAQDAFKSASNVENDMLRIARAELYVSATGKLLGEDRVVKEWAEKAYRDLSTAESLAWRILAANKEKLDGPLAVRSSVGFFNTSPIEAELMLDCKQTHEEQIESYRDYVKMLNNVSSFRELRQHGRDVRVAKLKEIYTYKTPLATYLRGIHSRIKELSDPVTIPLDDYEHGFEVAARLDDTLCENRKHNTYTTGDSPLRHLR